MRYKKGVRKCGYVAMRTGQGSSRPSRCRNGALSTKVHFPFTRRHPLEVLPNHPGSPVCNLRRLPGPIPESAPPVVRYLLLVARPSFAGTAMGNLEKYTSQVPMARTGCTLRTPCALSVDGFLRYGPVKEVPRWSPQESHGNARTALVILITHDKHIVRCCSPSSLNNLQRTH
jgi:hypothetical protein